MRTESRYRRLARRRIGTTSYRTCIFSITGLHTETVNIWSHLLGTLWFCGSATRFAVTAVSLPSQNAAAILIFLLANAFCFASSTLYHLFADHADAISWLRLDHLGIVCAIWASSISFVTLSLECYNGERWVYMLLVTSAAALCFVRLSVVSLHSPSGRWRRICTHVTLGGVAALPGLRCWHQHTLGQNIGLLNDFGWLIVVNGLGGVIYATHLLDQTIGMELGVPDASHHVMHLMVFGGAWNFERGLMSAYQNRLDNNVTSCA